MKKTAGIFLLILLLLPLFTGAAPLPDLSGYTISQLELLRREADGRLRLGQLSDAAGYLPLVDAEGLARDPDSHLNKKYRLVGDVLLATQLETGFALDLSPTAAPGRVIRLLYSYQEGERLLLPGDRVEAFGTFTGLSPFLGTGSLHEGAPLIAADLVIHQLPEAPALAAPPHAASRQDPAPTGIAAHYPGDWFTAYASFDITLTKSQKGAQALKIVRDWSRYNINPTRSQEYILVWLDVSAIAAPREIAAISQEDFHFVGADGRVYPQHFLINPPSTLREMAVPGSQSAVLACLIDKGDSPLVVYQKDATRPLWFDPNQ